MKVYIPGNMATWSSGIVHRLDREIYRKKFSLKVYIDQDYFNELSSNFFVKV